MAQYCTEDNFILDDSPDQFGFLETDAPFPLPVELGGTGQNGNSRIRTNLSYNDGAYNSPFGSSQQIHVTGTLPIANGGTGATDAAGARGNLGLGTAAVADIDATLSNSGDAADAKATGDADSNIDFKADVDNYAAQITATQYAGLYIGESTIKSSNYGVMTVVYGGLPAGKYLVDKRLLTTFRVAYGDVGVITANYAYGGGYASRTSAESDPLYIELPSDNLYLYVQLWGSGDSNSLKDADVNLASLVIKKLPDESLSVSGEAADAKATGDAVGELKSALNNATENLAASATTISGLYISTSGRLTSISSVDRLICVEAEANKTYRIKKTTSTVMRVGCGSSASLTSGDSLSSYSGHSSASSNELTVTTDSTNYFIYVQLFAESDSSALKTISANLPTLTICEDVAEELSNLDFFITLESFGAVGDGTTDDTQAFNDAITYSAANGYPKIVGKRGAVYGITAPITLSAANTKVTFDLNDATIIALSQIEEIFYIQANNSNKWNEMKNIYVDCNGLAQYGFYCKYVSTFHFEHIKIVDFTDIAFYIKKGNCVIHDMYIDWTLDTEGATPIGIQNDGTDSKIHNVTMRNCKIGVYNCGGLTYYSNIHPWIASGVVLPGSIAFWINASTSLTNCYADTFEIAVQMDGQKSLQLNGFSVFINNNFYTNAVMNGTVPKVFNLMSTAQSLSSYPAASYGIEIDGMSLNMTLTDIDDVAEFSNVSANDFKNNMRCPEGVGSIRYKENKINGVPLATWQTKADAIMNSANGSVANLKDGGNNLPVESLIVDIDYSSTGWTGDNITRTKANVFSTTWVQGGINSSGNDYGGNSIVRTDGYISVVPGVSYAIYRSNSTGTMNVRGYDKDKTFLGSGSNVITLITGTTTTNPMGANVSSCVISPKSGVAYIRFNDYSNDLDTEYMMVVGTTVNTTYEDYDGTTYKIDWSTDVGTIYGGTLDVVSGELISMYDSDGTELSDHVTYSLNETEVSTEYGENNFWSDTGDTSINYRADTKFYITNLINSL